MIRVRGATRGLVPMAALVLLGCATLPASQPPRDVELFDGYRMGQFIDEPRQLGSVREVQAAIESPWYYDRELVAYTSDGEPARPPFVLGTCAEYLAVEDQRLWPAYDPDGKAFMVLAIMCKASQAIVSAKPASHSYIRELAFDQNLPGVLPPELAFAISSSSIDRIRQAGPGETWGDMFGVDRYEPCDPRDGEHCGIYYDRTGGQQQVQLVARGDFNGDGVEDVLISAHNSVEGGTYAATRMYVLTRQHPGSPIELVRELDY